MLAGTPQLSVVVTTFTHERLADVLDLLGSLKAQTYAPIEILFVGEREPDLCDRVRRYADEHGMANVTVLFNDGPPGLSEGRNVGLRRARGEIIAFLDDDAVAEPDWAEQMLRAFRETDAIGITGTVLPLWQGKNMSWLPEEFYWLISCSAWTGWQGRTEARSAYGVNMAFRREAFRVAGEFLNETGYHMPMGEDLEFSLRVRARTGRRILFEPGPTVRHKVHGYRFTWRFIVRRSRQIGGSRRILHDLYPQTHRRQHLERDLFQRLLHMASRLPAVLLQRPGDAGRTLALAAAVALGMAWGYARPGATAQQIEQAVA